MSWEGWILAVPEGEGYVTTHEAAAELIGDEVPVSLSEKPAGLVTVIDARYEPGAGIRVLLRFGDDTPLGFIEAGGDYSINQEV